MPEYMYLENFIQRLRYKINIKYQDIRELTNQNSVKTEKSFFKQNKCCNAMQREVKQRRAQGGCLGTKSRRKT